MVASVKFPEDNFEELLLLLLELPPVGRTIGGSVFNAS